MSWFITWVIYEKPSDYPDRYVLRKWDMDVPIDPPLCVGTLEECRQVLPKGLTKMPPEPGDDEVIYEIWM